MRRLAALLLAVASLVALVLPAGASAKGESSTEQSRKEIATARAMVAQAVEAAKAGDRERAYQLARSAYLDHFEVVEIPLRLRDPNLVLDGEFAFAELRNGIRDGGSVGQFKRDARTVDEKLLDVDRALSKKGVAAPALAFAFSFSILFREGVEAVLLIAILLGSLAAGSSSNYKRPLGLGVLGAVGLTGLTWVLSTVVLDIAPVSREVLEGVTALVAVVVLIMVSFWLVARLEQKRRMEFMRARVAGAMAAGTSLAFAGLGFTAVYREGFETVLFYQALTLFAKGLGLWVALGAGAAAVALGAVAYAIIGAGKKLPIKPMLVTGASMLLLLSVAFVGNAIRSLQGADVLSVHPVSGFRLPVFLAELTGIHPTTEGLLTQAGLLLVFVLGAVWVFAVKPRVDRRRATEPAAA